MGDDQSKKYISTREINNAHSPQLHRTTVDDEFSHGNHDEPSETGSFSSDEYRIAGHSIARTIFVRALRGAVPSTRTPPLVARLSPDFSYKARAPANPFKKHLFTLRIFRTVLPTYLDPAQARTAHARRFKSDDFADISLRSSVEKNSCTVDTKILFHSSVNISTLRTTKSRRRRDERETTKQTSIDTSSNRIRPIAAHCRILAV